MSTFILFKSSKKQQCDQRTQYHHYVVICKKNFITLYNCKLVNDVI